MMYCKELNLPQPLNGRSSFVELTTFKKYNTRSYAYATSNVLKYLNTELLDIFNQLNLEPAVLILFGHGGNANYSLEPRIHTDISLVDQQWVKVPFAINWEITENTPTIKWWDTLSMREVYPYTLNEPLANGIHYGQRSHSGGNNNIEDFTCVYSHKLTTTSTLIRTDLPHSVEHTNFKNRFSISLRFNKTVLTWEEIINLFNRC